MGTLASTTTWAPPGRWTSTSGRSRPSSVVAETCSVKSQWATIPAISTTRRSCTSPHRPRVCGARSAVTKLAVSRWSRSLAVPSCLTCSVRVA